MNASLRWACVLVPLLLTPAWGQAPRPSASVAADHDRARDLNNAAASLYNAGNVDAALALYGKVITLNPTAAVYYNNRAAARDRKGDKLGALADYDAAIRMDPKPGVYYKNRALVLQGRGDKQRALADLTRAVQLEPKAGLFRMHRANVLLELGDVTEAAKDFRTAAKLDPKLKHAGDLADSVAKLPRTAPPQKDGPKAGERRAALVIGNGAYRGSVSSLANPRRDAAAIAEALRGAGFESVELVEDAGRERMLQALDAFADKAAASDWAVVYFAGHGIEAAGANYLLPVDAVLADNVELQDKAVPLDRVLSAIQRAGKLRLVMLDACRDDPGFARVRNTVATRSVSRGLAPANADRIAGTLVAYAAKHGATAADGSGLNSPYAAALIKYLKQPRLEVQKLFRLVRDEVVGATGGVQEPYTYGSLSGDDLFFRPAG